MRSKIIELMKDVLYCFKLSWESSVFYTVIRLVGKILTPLLTLLLTFITKDIVNILSSNDARDDKYYGIVLFLCIDLAIVIVLAMIDRIEQYIESVHGEILQKEISMKMMGQAINADLEFFDNSDFYDKFEAVGRDMNSIVNVMWSTISCISSLITFVSTFIIVSELNIIYAILMVGIAIPSSLLNRKFTKALYKLSLDQMNEERKLNYLYGIVTGREHASDVRLYNIGDQINQRYNNLWNHMFNNRKRVMKKKTTLVSLVDLLPFIIRFLILFTIMLEVLDGSGTVGDYVLYAGVLEQLYSSVYSVSIQILSIYEDKLRIDNVKSFEKIDNKIQDDGNLLLEEFHTLEFKNVSFRYPGTDHQVLNNINFIIGKQERVALVGLNGSGKSTIIKLIMRFYDADEGVIEINGINIHQYKIESLRKAFSTCFQVPTIFGFTLRENITIGDNESQCDDRLVREALQKGDGFDILKNATYGLDTYLTRYLDNEGLELSGGQYQKVTLARAFYRPCQFIILDEPSAALDPEAEHKIFHKIKQLCENKTVLFTSHRLSNISIADKIIVLENGVIIEQGTHKQLMNKQGRYYTLYNYQAEKFNQVS